MKTAVGADAGEWLAIQAEGFEGYEVHRVEPRVRSWRCSGPTRPGHMAPAPREMQVSYTGVVVLQLGSGKGERRRVDDLREGALTGTTPRELPQRYAKPVVVPELVLTPVPPQVRALAEQLAAEPASDVEAHIEMLDGTLARVGERLGLVVTALAELQDAIALPAAARPAWVDALEGRLEAIEQGLIAASQTRTIGEVRTSGGGRGLGRSDSDLNGKMAPADFQRAQAAACVAALGIETTARACGVDSKAIDRLMSGRQRSISDPARLDKLYVALRAEQLDGADDQYDAMTTRVAQHDVRHRRAELDTTAWAMRGEG